ncbi:hypothetical protein Cantr_07557 [Candida viswanathii]|uniref:Uncharacterized protein n=1 Tax=Candida viswanathii TaxID=5486 RepID=A0A367Y360_9ASCO|nr:hypothetical protein Cantr_07557 [Candida viswanathii]
MSSTTYEEKKGSPRPADHPPAYDTGEPPAITKAVDIECGHTWIAWHEITKAVWTAIVFTDTDLSTWKWFKFAKYDGNHVVAKLIEPQGFRIYGGPGHTSEIYRRIKVAVGKRVETLEFVAVAQFLDLLFVFTVWRERRHHATIYAALKEDWESLASLLVQGLRKWWGLRKSIMLLVLCIGCWRMAVLRAIIRSPGSHLSSIRERWTWNPWHTVW